MTNRTCSVPDCTTGMSSGYLRKGYCERHYYSWRKYDDPTYVERRKSKNLSTRRVKPRLPIEPCHQCGEEYEPKSNNAKYCSVHCRSWAAFLGPGKSKRCSDCEAPMVASRTSKPGPGRCKECAKHGIAGYGRGCRCTICRGMKNKAQREYGLRVLGETGRWPRGGWISTSRRLELYERDKWTCQICLKPVNRGNWTGALDDATLDHIKPRSKGGSHESENLRTACWSCNARRGNREDMEVA